jgi:AraC family transcriptional regulator, melibiose operon regulatory protein
MCRCLHGGGGRSFGQKPNVDLTMRPNSISINRIQAKTFLFCKVITMSQKLMYDFVDESVPANPHDPRGSPIVVYGDHSFCAGVSSKVQKMVRPHMHSQIEINFLLRGEMTYRIDGRQISITQGRFVMFWGMVPHQVVEVAESTHFVCLYVPMSVFLGLPMLSQLREAIFRGAVIEANDMQPYDREILVKWQVELLTDDKALAEIVRDELTARIRRIDRDGWRDLREQAPILPHIGRLDREGIEHIESMARFIGEHAQEDINVEAVAAAARLHPNYAMSLYKRMTGMTISQSVTRHRLDIAQSMLIATDRPVARISFDCGFGSLSSFYAAFEKRFGTSPKAYRNRVAGVAA